MPLGIQRLNAKKSQPNDRIVFIKPLKGRDEAIAQDFLERIAAQCLPIMRENHLSVMSLEEYEFNTEFVGRNFNAGEVIQLVLKARSGHWLPFDYVQMVMMHELAHCKQMNHSRAFWAVRNQYAEQMRHLWARGFTGEGLWGRGAFLSTGEWEKNSVRDGESLPEHLCGGTYRSAGRKRKAKSALTYQEQKERRILKKFGANGVALGEDEEVKKKLEGKKVAAKPRVAGSARGRDLRAAAALARFDQQQKKEVKEDEGMSSGEEYEEEGDAVDLDGRRLLDSKGRGMIKVCEDENPEDEDVKQEILELRSCGPKWFGRSAKTDPLVLDKEDDTTSKVKEEGKSDKLLPRERETTGEQSQQTTKPASSKDPPVANTPTGVCPVCSFANDKMSPTCAVCSNVLHLKNMPGAWACTSQACRGSAYRNATDCGWHCYPRR
ncbi:hypothetical protein OQA88_3819 [Cercophora sp. LCS_1]